MDDLIQILVQALVMALFSFSLAFLVWALFRFPVESEPPVHRRIAAAVGIRRNTVFENPVLAPIMSLALLIARQLNFPSLRQQVRQDLDASGNVSGYSVEEYIAIALASSALMGLCATVFEFIIGGGALLLFVPLLATIGFVVPLWVLHDTAGRRVARISKQLPYTLDLVALTMAAGSSFNEAVETLIRDEPEEDLNQELRLALSEMEFGTTRSTALANLAKRIPLESLRSVVGAVNQAEKLGTPMSSILKLQADMLRVQRSVRAEKLSASASLRILVPSMLILIAVVVVVFAPILIAGNFSFIMR